jgi:heme/copper-type cytochrome/quinol oxidase subunit 2
MKKEKSRSARRTWVLVNYLCLLSLVNLYVRTGLWTFVHRPIGKLDERELMQGNTTLRIAYSIFSMVVLLFLLAVAVFGFEVDIVMVVVLLLLAHILPASIIAWTGKGI